MALTHCKRCFARGLLRVSAAMAMAMALPSASGANVPQASLTDLLDVASPSEREGFIRLLKQVAEANGDRSATLKILDEAIAELRQPTKMRGLVQFYRAGLLNSDDEELLAGAAIEESIRLLPEHSAPLIAASEIYTFSGKPGMAADYLIRAGQKDPAAVRRVDNYEIDALIGRLREARDLRRIGALSDMLLGIGWTGRDLSSSSSLARDAIKRRLADGDVVGARALVEKLVVPSDSRDLLYVREYEPLWPDIEKWAGPMLERQWEIYLTEARARWAASKDASATREYVSALVSARHDATLIRDILPMFSERFDDDQFEMVFVVAPLAGALARQDRWGDVWNLFARAEKYWPMGSDANALNIPLSKARFLLSEDRPADALVQLDLALADAVKRRTEVNSGALAAMHSYRACALHELGRPSEAAGSIAAAISQGPVHAAETYVCLGDLATARQSLLSALKLVAERESAIRYLQVSEPRTGSGKYSRKIHARSEALKKDPALLAELSKYGRVLTNRLSDGAPKQEFPTN